ncbi:3'-5' exonuclease [Porphyromonas sp. COT-239 OH1446]|nr:3'-5' exonuclease [Porphyromonas sp. COT-239 OH1446]
MRELLRTSFASTISGEELSKLERIFFPGEIHLVERKSDVRKAVQQLKQSEAIGIDTETRPSFSAHKRYEVSLLQLSTDEHCFLFRLNKIGLHPELIKLLQDPYLFKVGLSLKDDLSSLKRLSPFEPAGFVELQRLCPGFGIREQGLQKIYAIVCSGYLSKSQRMSNWEAAQLSPAQQMYAALDAWASLQIYNRLIELPYPNPIHYALL